MNTLGLASNNHITDYSTHEISGNDVDSIARSVGLDWEYIASPIKYDTEKGVMISNKSALVYRSDTLQEVGCVGSRFNLVQPREIIQFYLDICSAGNFVLDALGCVNNGARIWGLARGTHEFRIQGQDQVKSNLFFATGNDGSLSTQVKLLSRRMICNNQLDAALDENNRWKIVIPHSTKVDFPMLAKRFGNVSDVWGKFEESANRLASKKVSEKQAFEFFYELYVKEKDSKTTIRRKTERMMNLYENHPTQQLRGTQGTLWGVVNAVTLEADWYYGNKRTTPENRFRHAMMGEGERNKAKIWKMVA